jgi:uncharacterized membrane protein
MLKKILIKDNMMMLIIFGLVIMVSVAILDFQKEPFSGAHFNYLMIGYYISWLLHYGFIKKQQKFSNKVVDDFGETLPLMKAMLETIKTQQAKIEELKKDS